MVSERKILSSPLSLSLSLSLPLSSLVLFSLLFF